MVFSTVQPGMRIDFEHAHALAYDLIRFTFAPIIGGENYLDSGGEHSDVFHTALTKALFIYSDNADMLTRTAHELGDSALHTLSVIAAVDEDLSTELERKMGILP